MLCSWTTNLPRPIGDWREPTRTCSGFPEMFEELKKTTELDQNNLEAKDKLGNLYLSCE